MRNAVGYVRVSTQGQARDGYSLSYQVDEIQHYCQENNLNLIRIYEDRGISGAKVDEEGLTVERESLQNMLAELPHMNIQSVIVLNTSRLWRSDMAKVLIQRELKRNQVDVQSIEQPNYSIFTHDPNDFLVNGMLELLDQYQRLEITLKLGRGRRKKAEQGGYAGGGIIFGYKSNKGQKAITIDEEKANIVRRLFELKVSHSMWTLTQFAEQLNSEGYHTYQGKAFTKVQIKRIFDHESMYRGTYIYGSIEAVGQHQAII
ncbi:recombinase family protein [Paenibacillus sp. 19GGS1-52]|uniref:recombinase family protein n=1 Tax=Paenibacillus sp. 19GGS1-52 TaxID=2758563 RepID=UPI001EFA3162|nr:recombinase family protein [Paenibacillus sp. 19GGS1-52]ULO09516.1 recombinase family protein [Paenibacillus sp. 19GGS1-52]